MKLGYALPDLARRLPPTSPPPVDPALLASARAEGEAEGHARGFAEGLTKGMQRQQASQLAAIEASLAKIAAEMHVSCDEAARAAALAGEALAMTLVASLDAALLSGGRHDPHPPVPGVVAALVSGLATRPYPQVFVSPCLADEIAARLPPDMGITGDATLMPGDARIEWLDGAQIITASQRHRAVRWAFEAAGFDSQREAP
jgi:hypothetical protein